MQASNIYLIAAAEIAGLLLFVCVFLVFQNRSLKRVVKKLQLRMEQLVHDLKLARPSKSPEAAKSTASLSYKHQLNQQLEFVREHHTELGSDRDIMLDIDPETPIPRRVSALRYALLLAEKEATSGHKDSKADWKLLQRRYEQIFQYNNDYATAAPTSSDNSEELDALHQELVNTKKRVNNLERFKALYFDLEEKWSSVRDNAKTHYHEISKLTADSVNAEAIETALHAYQSNYGEIGALIETGIDNSTNSISGDSANEIQHLRAVAVDQHRIITELQRKLRDTSSEEEREVVVSELQGQLQKQIRFVQESETCIQLLEDELNNTHKELEQLRSRLNALPKLKTDIMELRNQNDDYELQIAATKSENRRLMTKVQNIESAPPSDDGDVWRLKKEVSELETRYAELEEKFLDLKLE